MVLNFTVSGSLSNPQAGNDATVSYCGPQGQVDLLALLTANPDTFGQWEEITTSGALNGNFWDSALAEPGNYQFRYRVFGLCNASDESLVTISLLPVLLPPIISSQSPMCAGGNLPLWADNVPDATFQWTGPDGFSSTEQNPVIENISAENSGEYSLFIALDGCTSAVVSMTIDVMPNPEFTLSAGCVDNAFILSATPSNNAFNPDEVSYAWSGPDNFSANPNPVNISGLPGGLYTLTINSSDGCNYTESIEVAGTLCGIPKGVSPNNDGDNDNWNLSGLDVKHVKIFNRYGMLMYEKANYVNEWDGRDKNGHELPSATYYYLIEFNSGENKSGWVYLQRQSW